MKEEKTMPLSEAARLKKIEYNKKRNKEKTKRFILSFTKSIDDDIIKHLENQEHYSAYIKELIEKDMKKKK